MKLLAAFLILVLPLSSGELTSPQFEQAAVKLTLLLEEDHGWWELNEKNGKFCVVLNHWQWRGVERETFLPCERDAISAVKQAIRFEQENR